MWARAWEKVSWPYKWTGFNLRFLSSVGKETKQAQACYDLSLEKNSGLSFETSVDSCILRCLKWLLKKMLKVLSWKSIVFSCWSSIFYRHVYLEVQIAPTSMEHVCAHAILHLILSPIRIFSVLLCRQVTCFVFVVLLKAIFGLH